MKHKFWHGGDTFSKVESLPINGLGNAQSRQIYFRAQKTKL